MRRRDFLLGGMGAMAGGLTGCAGVSQIISPPRSNPSPDDIDRFVVSLDSAMDRIAKVQDGGRFLKSLDLATPGKETERHVKQSMRTLLLVGSFGDLPVESQVHPAVQKRLRYSSSEMEAALFGSMNRVKSLSPTARADMQSALRNDATLGDRVVNALDLEAAVVGVSDRRRTQLRSTGTQVIRRLSHSSDSFIEEYVTKYERLNSRLGSASEAQRLLYAHMGKSAFNARVQRAETASRHWQSLELQEKPIAYTLMSDGVDYTELNQSESNPMESQSPQTAGGTVIESEDSDSSSRYSTSLYILGIGAATTLAGLLLLAADEDSETGLVMGITVGPITIAIGLIAMLVEGVQDLVD